MRSIINDLTPAEKWECVKQLRETAWLLKRAGVKAKNPTWREEEIEEEVRKIFLYAVT